MREKQKARLGRRIKQLRKRQGLTQDRLGEAVGISSKYLSSIERGRENPTLDTLLGLAEQLQVKPYELFLFSAETTSTKVLRKEIDRLLAEADDERLHAVLRVLEAALR